MKVLNGPYGTVLSALGGKEFADPAAVIDNIEVMRATYNVARQYSLAGARVATTNTFGLRGKLHQGREDEYDKALSIHYGLVKEALIGDSGSDIYIALGPYGDCYSPDSAPEIGEAEDFHARQLDAVLRLNGKVSAVLFETVCTVREAIGIALAAKKTGVPAIVSFVMDNCGRILSQETLNDAVAAVDRESGVNLLGFGMNCCPIEGGKVALERGNGVGNRIKVFYPNASDKDPRELDGSETIEGVDDIKTRVRELVKIGRKFNLEVVGGCCGHDHDSIRNIVDGVFSLSDR